MRTAACRRDRYAASHSTNRTGNQFPHQLCKGYVELFFVGQTGRRPRHDDQVQTRESLPVVAKTFTDVPLQPITVDSTSDLLL